MGCTNIKGHKISSKLEEFETKNILKIIESNDKEIKLNTLNNKIGDYYNKDIKNDQYFYFEDRFKELVSKELKKTKKKDLNFETKKKFIENILQNQKLRKKILKIIKRKGIKHSYRWNTWQILQNYNKKCLQDFQMLKKRQKMYPYLIKLYNPEVETIVNKDVIRTSRHKMLFSEMDSIGTKKLWNVCKAIGCFFKRIGYIQGMNFVVGFILEISAMEEFESFNFIINFWKKNKNLYFGMYEENFPMIQFLNFSFHFILKKENRKVEEKIMKMDFPNELWLTKWFLSFFTFSLNSEYVLRIFDFLMINDCMGLVYIALVITDQLKKYFIKGNIGSIVEIIQNKENLSKKLNFYKFVKKLKKIDYSNDFKLKILIAYNNTLNIQKKNDFSFYFKNLKKHWFEEKKKFYDDFEINNDYQYDYDSDSLEDLESDAKSSIYLNDIKTDLNHKERIINKKKSILLNRKMHLIKI